MNPLNTQAPVALITGSARRIGATIAEYLHGAGYQVVIHYRHAKEDACALTQRLNQARLNSAFALCGDLTHPGVCEKLVQETIAWAKRLDLLVNNASLFLRTDITKPDEQDWHNLFMTNVHAPFWLSKSAYPYLAEQKGCIINITDLHATKPLKDYAIYCQSKAAFAMQTKVLAREFAPNVRVNAVAPGAIAWPEGENQLSKAIQEKIIAQTPLKKHGEPLYIAQALLALAQNPFVTGETLHVDGGRHLL